MYMYDNGTCTIQFFFFNIDHLLPFFVSNDMTTIIVIIYTVAHSLPEPVQFSVYWLPGNNQGSTYQAVSLMEDTIYYTDETRLLAEQLILSVNDNTQVGVA